MVIEHSGAEDLLKGTEYLQSGKYQGKTIKAVLKPSENQRIVKFTDGTKVQTTRDVVRASVDVKLDKIYKPKALKTLKEAKTVPTTKVRIGGPKEGKIIKYASKEGAKKAVDNYYKGEEGFDKYKEGKYPRRCKKG